MLKNVDSFRRSKFKPQKGFGGNPLERENWWKMTDDMIKRAKKYGLLQKIRAFYRNSAKNDTSKFDVYIPKEKFTNYLLSPRHSTGKHKAKVFKAALGYTIDNWEDLLDNILDNFDESKLVEIARIADGIKYNCIMNLTGSNGNTCPVKTTWILRPGTDTYQLVTAIVEKEI